MTMKSDAEETDNVTCIEEEERFNKVVWGAN